eukprot:768673-Hanusia_phi.AAC.4
MEAEERSRGATTRGRADRNHEEADSREEGTRKQDQPAGGELVDMTGSQVVLAVPSPKNEDISVQRHTRRSSPAARHLRTDLRQPCQFSSAGRSAGNSPATRCRPGR